MSDQWFVTSLKLAVVCILACVCVLMAVAAWNIATYQETVPVACEPSVVGLRKNGREIPLTSAQRDSLAKGLTTRPR